MIFFYKPPLFKYIFILLILAFRVDCIYGQTAGIIINEVSNGPSGRQEWVELLVIGNPVSPTTNVDLTGWIFDDNNGDFESGGAGFGINSGHIILNSTFNNVPPGSLIVIYNEEEKDALIPVDDPTDSNGDGIYVLPADHSSFDACTNRPSVADSGYTCVSTVVNASALVSNVWEGNITLRNSGDVAQIRMPDATFFHGFSYGSINLPPFPNFPISGNPSFRAGAGGTGTTFGFECGDWEDSNNFFRSDNSSSTTRSPGVSNSALNQIFIDKITNGTFDYSNLANSINCTVPIKIITNRNATYRVNN